MVANLWGHKLAKTFPDHLPLLPQVCVTLHGLQNLHSVSNTHLIQMTVNDHLHGFYPSFTFEDSSLSLAPSVLCLHFPTSFSRDFKF